MKRSLGMTIAKGEMVTDISNIRRNGEMYRYFTVGGRGKMITKQGLRDLHLRMDRELARRMVEFKRAINLTPEMENDWRDA